MKAGEKLLALRKRAGITQMELAEASGVAQGHISEVENGKHRLGMDAAMRIAPVLKVEWPSFFEGDSRNVDNAS